MAFLGPTQWHSLQLTVGDSSSASTKNPSPSPSHHLHTTSTLPSTCRTSGITQPLPAVDHTDMSATTPSPAPSPPKSSPAPLPPSASRSSSQLTVDKSTIISDRASLTGPITIGPSTLIHPTARLHSPPPPASLTLGSHCIIEEGVSIEAADGEALTIGNWCLIECGAVIRSSMGHANWVRVKGQVGKGAKVGRGVEVGVGQRVDTVVPDGSIVTCDGRLLPPANVKEREKRIMEQVQLSLTLNAPLFAKQKPAK